MAPPVFITAAARTPIGGFQGALQPLSGSELGALALRAALERDGTAPGAVDECLMGCVLPAGQGQAPARQAALGAGLPVAVPATTINKVCGSGMKAVMLAHDALALGQADRILAGGMESMTNAPYLLPKARGGLRLGHGEVKDHMFLDGLEDAYGAETRGRLMGTFAEDTARALQFTREAQDSYAIASLERAQEATATGAFTKELVTVTVKDRAGTRNVASDEQPQSAKKERIATLKPAFAPDGTVTAANSSSISDGAAALMLKSAKAAEADGSPILARIVAQQSYAAEPRWFTTAPIKAIERLLAKTGWRTDDVDLFEINEAFAVVVLAAMRELALPHEKVNVHGGACALGHPIGASGARIIVTLLHTLERRGLKRGIASLCIGGGEATAIAIERVA